MGVNPRAHHSRKPRTESTSEAVPPPDGGAHVCRSCGEPFVSPLSVVRLVAQTRFVVELECANCEDVSVALMDDRALEQLDRELDEQTRGLLVAVRDLELAEQLDRIDRFAEALRYGHILPEDFARGDG
jgi:hypothetical protein